MVTVMLKVKKFQISTCMPCTNLITLSVNDNYSKRAIHTRLSAWQKIGLDYTHSATNSCWGKTTNNLPRRTKYESFFSFNAGSVLSGNLKRFCFYPSPCENFLELAWKAHMLVKSQLVSPCGSRANPGTIFQQTGLRNSYEQKYLLLANL
jgi:hypothetical protein